MSPMSIPIAMVAALTLGAGIFHALVFSWRGRRRENLSFALTCSAMVCYDFFTLYLYGSHIPEQAAFWYKARMMTLGPTAIFLVWFLHDYTGHPSKWPVYAFTAYFSITLLLGLMFPGGVAWTPSPPELRNIFLPFGLSLSFYETSLTSLGFIRFLIRAFLLAYFCWVTVWYLRNGSARKGVAMLLSFTVFFAGLANDTAVRLRVYDFIYVFEFAFLGVVLFMTYDLVNEVVEGAKVKDQLAESESRYRLLAENVTDNVWLLDLDLVVLYSSPSVRGLIGYTPEEIEGRNVLDTLTPDSHDVIRETLADVLDEHKQFPEREVQRRMRLKHVRKDGGIVHIEVEAGFIYDEERRPVGLIGVSRDVEARTLAENALKQSEEKYRRMYENIQDVYFEVDLDGIIMEISPSIKMVSSYSREELIGRNVQTLAIEPQDRQARLDLLSKHGQINDYEVSYRDKDGSVIRGSVTLSYLLDDNGVPRGTVGTIRDMEARKRAEEALRESESRFRLLAENSTDIIWTMTLGGKLTYISPSVERVSGFTVEEIMKMPMEGYTTTKSIEKIFSVLAEELGKSHEERQDSITLEIQQYTKSGSINDIEISANWILDDQGQPIGIRGSSRDIRERKKAEQETKNLEAQLLQARKMEAIGTLAGGIAHDFNNILHPIIGSTQMLLEENGLKPSVRESLGDILQAASRARELVGQILTIGRRAEDNQTSVELLSIIQDVLSLMRASIPATIEIKQEILSPDGVVLGDPSQLHQVLLNLCTNAYQAMRHTGGELVVGLGPYDSQNDSNPGALSLNGDKYYRVTVADTGPGMSKTVLDRIFEPYFTTKKVGEGSGMGLAVVHAIVKKHNGDIRVTSDKGKGAVFEVFLPIYKGPALAHEAPSHDSVQGGKERILLVDDEDQILRMTSKMLEQLGYQVWAEGKSTNALELFSHDPYAFDLILTDMTMPKLTGDRLAKKALAIRPDIPVILCTGYSESVSKDEVRDLGIRQCLYKPLERSHLAAALRAELDQAP